jgi:hypothetical protein
MRLLHEVVGDLDDHAEEHAITPLGRERGTIRRDRFIQADLGKPVWDRSWALDRPRANLPIRLDELPVQTNCPSRRIARSAGRGARAGHGDPYRRAVRLAAGRLCHLSRPTECMP